jgi:putative tricarboxylic transport membrane protein
MRKIEKQDRLTFDDFKATFVTMVKSSAIGVIVGAIPGTGSAIASFLAYNEAKRCARPDERFGEGELKGVAAPEAANNGATASTLIPLLTLGIPGDVVSATLLGAFTMHGLIVGPKLFEESKVPVYAILIGCVLSQFVMYLQGKYLLRLFVKITRVPQELLTALLIVVCCVGAFAIANTLFDIQVMMLFGCVAYFMQKVDLPPVPIVLGMVLGPIAEANLRNALVMSNDSWLIFSQRPICFTFLVLTVVFMYLLKKGDAKRNKMEQAVIEKIDGDTSEGGG